MTKNERAIGDYVGGPVQLPIGIATPDGATYETVELREMGGDEEDILLDEAKKRTAVTDVLKNVITKIGDITQPARIRQLVDYLPQGDATFLCVRLRQMSLGNDFVFGVTCPSKRCLHHSPNVKVLLNERLCTFRPSSVELKHEYPVELPDGTAVVRMLRIGDQSAIAEINATKGAARMTHLMHLSLVSVDGEEKPSPDVIAKWSSRKRNAIRAVTDAHSFGLDLSVAHVCANPECQTAFNMVLPIMSEPRFFFPSGTGQR